MTPPNASRLRKALPLILAVASLGALLAFVAAAVGERYARLDVEISPFGWVVMAGATAASFLLAAALMGLAFYSARKGYDARPPFDEGA
jgi:hypothetical protein